MQDAHYNFVSWDGGSDAYESCNLERWVTSALQVPVASVLYMTQGRDAVMCHYVGLLCLLQPNAPVWWHLRQAA